MQAENTYIAILRACADASSIHLGEEIHKQIIASRMHICIELYNAIISMYSKCSRLDLAILVSYQFHLHKIVLGDIKTHVD